MSADTEFLERLVFDESSSQDWVRDVWDLNPVLGERAAKLLEMFDLLVEHYPPEQLRQFIETYYHNYTAAGDPS